PGLALEFHVYHDRAGRYAKIEADPKVRPALGALVGHKYRHCAAAGAAMAPPAPAPAARAAQEPGMALPIDMLRQPAFKSAYFRALGALARDPWLTVLDGPQNPTSKLRLGGMDFVHGGVCKPHDCADNKITFLYAASAGRVYAKVSMGGRAGLLGNPPQAVAAELERLWRADWPQR
ncbi:MAG: hypothetical protein JNJ60_12910, partial [Rhodocyclaceae bacterium]|nr:hypothetical protein [Rhodocyclaceae bacterium]